MNKALIFDRSYLNGEWVADGSATFDVVNPADNKKIAKVKDASLDLTQKAIDAAAVAFKSWSKKTARERAVIMEKWHDLILSYREDLAVIMTMECGKPLAESKGEVLYGASFIKWFAEEGKRAYGDVIPAHSSDRRLVVIKQPVGVVAAITPWNFPLAMITRKVAPALAAGCTVVIRPSEDTPLTALVIAHLAELAGFPKGVINVVVSKDPASIGQYLCESDQVSKISFTGSTRVGQLLMSQSASTLKKLSLELGGNAPFIVFEDADINEAVKGAIASKYRNAGQTCVCVNRFIVHEQVYEEFIDKLAQATANLKVGNGMNDETAIGPMIHSRAMQKTKEFVADALSKGGDLRVGGKAMDACFYQPTVIGNATSEMKFAKEEIFGPVSAVFKFSTDQEAIEIANDTIYGLASYFYTKDVNRCWKVAEALEYGMVGINEGIISTEVAPFGGVKYSGQGREGSKYGIEDYLEIKYLCFGGVN